VRVSLLLVLMACEGAPPAPSEAPDAGSSRAPVAAPAEPSAADPFAGCRRIAVERTVSWSCGPHKVVLARYPDGLPELPDRPFAENAPATSVRPLQVGERTIEGQLLQQPPRDGEQLITLLVRDPETATVASCALALRGDQDPEGRLRWCESAVAAALGG
jgi:hypothetical protein